MSSMVRFLFHLFSFCDARQAWQTQLSTDNKPLLQRIMEYQQYKTYFPNATSNADWDIVQAKATTCWTNMRTRTKRAQGTEKPDAPTQLNTGCV
jgi:hypothetical protein